MQLFQKSFEQFIKLPNINRPGYLQYQNHQPLPLSFLCALCVSVVVPLYILFGKTVTFPTLYLDKGTNRQDAKDANQEEVNRVLLSRI
jgi:hypothetical protein